MADTDRSDANDAQAKIARKYRRLGYEVIRNPSSDALPGFMQGITPDMIARSDADNVVIEVKESKSLKGANELVSIADKVSDQSGWRFELVVLGDDEIERAKNSEAATQQILRKAKTLIDLKFFDVAYLYLTAVLEGTASDVAHASGLKVGHKSDRDILRDLGFRGVLPQEMVTESLSALSVGDLIRRASDNAPDVSEQDVRALLDLCEGMRTLL